MHVLWISDSPDTPSGFGNVTRFVCEGLARRGHRVSILGWQTHEVSTWNGCQVYPMGADPMGSDALFAFLMRYRPDVVVALADVWWLPFFSAPHVRRQMELTDTPWAQYFPVDGNTEREQLPPSWTELLREVDVPIAMSQYGRRIANRCGIECEYIPHGVDLDLFCPPRDREEAKARIGAPGKFIVLSDSRNQPRKMLPRLLEAFARFAADRRDVLLHLHTDPDDEFTQSGYYSYDVRADVRHLGIEAQVRFSSGLTMKKGGGLPLAELAAYYQAADVHLLASSGEGFGLPTLQAAAAGAVPMASAYSASLELVEGHGEAIAIAEWTENEFGIRRALIDVEDAADKLARYHQDRDLLREHSTLARQFAMSYGWREIVDQWDRLLRRIVDRRQRITRPLRSKAEPLAKFAPQIAATMPGVSVTVQVVERQFGRLEAAILADARRHATDIRIPVGPEACQVGGVRVLRRFGYVCVAPADTSLFYTLKRIFPILTAWAPSFSPSHEGDNGDPHLVECTSPEEARYDLAQSVLMLNVGGGLPEVLLIDAALYGVPCIGSPEAEAQRVLWPELATDDLSLALTLARGLLTNAAHVKQLAARAQARCARVYKVNEEDSARWLRRLHAAQQAGAAVRGG